MAAVELALITPVLFGIVGAIILFGLGVHTRAQMVEITHRSVRVCAASLPTSISGVNTCVNQQLSRELASTKLACTPSPGQASTQQLNLTIPGPWQMWAVTASLACTVGNLGIPLLGLLPGGGPQAVTISAQSTAPFIPGSG